MPKYKIYKFIDNTQEIRETSHALFDGYVIGDRFLEGCYFVFSVIDDGTDIEVKPTIDTKAWLESKHINVEEWCKKAKEAILTYDIFTTEDGSDAFLDDGSEQPFMKDLVIV